MGTVHWLCFEAEGENAKPVSREKAGHVVTGVVRRGESVQKDERDWSISSHPIVDLDTATVIKESALQMRVRRG
jgi:hypothetical protein